MQANNFRGDIRAAQLECGYAQFYRDTADNEASAAEWGERFKAAKAQLSRTRAAARRAFKRIKGV